MSYMERAGAEPCSHMSLSAQYVSDDIVLSASIRCSCAVLRQIQASALSLDVELMKAEVQPCRPVRLFVCWFVVPWPVLEAMSVM